MIGNEHMLFYYLSLLDTTEHRNQFEAIYSTYRNLMYYIAKRILKDDSLAEDAVHNAFIRIINHLDKLQDINSHKTKGFLVIVVENTAKDIYNKRKNDNISLDSFEVELSDNRDLEESVIDEINITDLVKKIESLPDIYRDVLMMRFIYEYSYNAISEILNISETTARKRLERARQKLLQIIEKETKYDLF